MKIFRLNKTYSIVCNSENTRYGFRHLASLIKDGTKIDGDKACYYNRTWESYEYQSVILGLIDKTMYLTDKEKRRFRNKEK